METFAQRLKRLRVLKGLTLKEVAASVGVPPTTYRDWEYGKSIRGEPYLKISKILGVSVYELFGSEKQDRDLILKQIELVQTQLSKVADSVRTLF